MFHNKKNKILFFKIEIYCFQKTFFIYFLMIALKNNHINIIMIKNKILYIKFIFKTYLNI